MQLEDESSHEADEAARLLGQAITFLTEQEVYQDPLFLPNAKRAMRGAVTWILKQDSTAGDHAPTLRHADEQDWTVTDITHALSRAAELIREHQQLADDHFVKDARRRTQGVLKWASDIEHHVARRTMPKTNTASKTDPKTRNTHGFRYAERV